MIKGNEFLFGDFTTTSANFKCFILMQIPLKLDIRLQDEQFINAQNNVKQKDLNSFFANISKKQYLSHLTQSPLSCHNCRELLLVSTSTKFCESQILTYLTHILSPISQDLILRIQNPSKSCAIQYLTKERSFTVYLYGALIDYTFHHGPQISCLDGVLDL